ncbi:MAG: shikimate kinase AroK [Gammaproteobacteria bacterium]|nr:shikimate kinase AroK [Gammaproteobacteria bacterium]NIR82224.1 shikimate kinase AroK [Gammaproteobacteria bacterium]NIR90823.1 shikimate kinase AroK [Gammaproteobacteria bacterium]NIU03374.1 shikimate kinase AroK [Gammaproteobacteria bacterium]NIV50870.1 shikimate kinase AroK [Gammaproteobacteria bacterium]
MKIPDNIYIVGAMGAGKSTVGRQLAKLLGKRFVDCDREIEARTGATIALIFELEGEGGFRKREGKMLEELTQLDGVVMATGGGAVLERLNRSRLVSRGFVIYLDAPLTVLLARTAKDRSRPLLHSEDPDARLEVIVAERDPLYRQVADMVVKTDHRSPRIVAKEIVKRLSEV